MFKQTSITADEVKKNNITEKIDAVTKKQLIQFAELTGRLDTSFKIGKNEDLLQFKVGKPFDQ